jgi:hypothetical protein
MDTADKSSNGESFNEKPIRFTLTLLGDKKHKEKLTCIKFLKIIGFYLIGISCFVPYNAIVSGLDCFITYQKSYHPELVYSNLFFFSNFLFQVGIVLIPPKYSYYKLIQFSQILSILTLVINPLTLNWFEETPSFFISCIIVFLQGISSAVLLTCLYAFLNYLDPVFITSTVTGHGLAGIILNTTRFITINVYNLDQQDKATHQGEGIIIGSFYIFYYIAAGFLLVNVFIWMKLKNQIDIRKALRKVHPSLIMFDDEVDLEERCLSMSSFKDQDLNYIDGSHSPKSEIFKIKEVLKQQKNINFMILLNGIITFSIYPGILLKFEIFYKNKFYTNIVTILIIFNFFDVLGRELPKCFFFRKLKYIYSIIIMRLYFLVIFILMTYMRTLEGNNLFKNDYFFSGNLALFAFTNGFVISNSFTVIGDEIIEEKLKCKASPVLSCSLNLGTYLGSTLAYFFNYLASR